MPFVITPLYTGALGLYYVMLARRVINLRMGLRVALGDGTTEIWKELVVKKSVNSTHHT